MRKALVCCVMSACFAFSGCAKNGYTPLSSHQPGSKLFADTMGLLEAFTEHADLRDLFEQAATGSMPLADVTKADYYSFDDGTNAYNYRNKNGITITDESMRVDGKTAEAIRKVKEQLPGVNIRMRAVEGRICVNFYILKNTTGEDDGYFGEELYYSSHDLSDIKEIRLTGIEESWWFFSLPMPH